MWLLVSNIAVRGSHEVTSKSWEMPAAPSLRALYAIAKRKGTRAAILNQGCGDEANRNAAAAAAVATIATARSANGAVVVLLHCRFPIPAYCVYVCTWLYSSMACLQSTKWIPVSLAAVEVSCVAVV